jgi:hypothetical protein
MQKKKNLRLVNKFFSCIATVLCFAGIFCFFFLFWQDLQFSMKRNDKTPVAVVYFKHNTAQRRMIDHNIWERLQQASPVYDGDRIRTASDSAAYTVFSDGTRLDLDENTLVQVFTHKGSDHVQFIDGRISVTTSSTSADFSVAAGDRSVYFLKKTSAVLHSDRQGAVNTSVLTGSVTLKAESVPDKRQDLFSSIVSADVFTRFVVKRQFIAEKTQDDGISPESTVPVTVPEQIISEGNTAVYVPVSPDTASQKGIQRASSAEISQSEQPPVIIPPPDLSSLNGSVQSVFGVEKSAGLINAVTESVATQNSLPGAISPESDMQKFSEIPIPPPPPIAVEEPSPLPAQVVPVPPPVTKKRISKKIEKKVVNPPSFVSVLPVLKNPANGSSFTDQDFGGDHASIVFTWNKVSEAQEYQFSLYSGTTKSKQILSRTMSGISYVLTGSELALLDNGTFSWSVTAAGIKAGKKYTSKTSEASFTVSIAAVGDVIIDTAGLLNTN